MKRFRKLSVSMMITLIIFSTTFGMFGVEMFFMPCAKAETIELLHDAGNLTFRVDSHAALPFCMNYLGVQQSDEEDGWLDETFFFFDQSQYLHYGTGDIATGRKYIPGKYSPEFNTLAEDVPISFLEDGTVDKSYGSFTKDADINGQAKDIRVFQTAWSKQDEKWGIIQWQILNLYDSDLTEVRFGLRYYACVGGDNFDDKAHWNSTYKIYYIKDSGSSTYMGFASADLGLPVNLYWDGPNNDLFQDSDIYNAITSSPYVSGHHNDLGCVVGWTDDESGNQGLTLPAKESVSRALIVAGATSFADLVEAIERARNFYLPRALVISEISDEGTKCIEIQNIASTPQYLTNIRLSVNGGLGYWLGGTWDVNPIPKEGFSVWTLNGNDAFDSTEGDTIGLYDIFSGTKYDEVAFGQEGIAPDPVDDAVYGSISRVNIKDWVHSLEGMTFGQRNSVDNSITLEPDVVMNEVMFNPSEPEDGFIELMYIGSTSIDLNGFTIATDNIFSITESYILKPDDPYYIIFRDDAPMLFDNGHLSKSSDNVYLYDNYGSLLDMVGWNSAHQVDKTIKRIPDGMGAYQGYNDFTSGQAGWVFDSEPSIPFLQISPVSQYKFGEPSDVLWYDLKITNKMDTGELVDLFYQSLPNWIIEFYEEDKLTKITDSDSDGAPDISVAALSFVDISVKISILQSELSGDSGDTIVTVKANSNPSIQSSALVQTRFYPYLLPLKHVTPTHINVLGYGSPEKATITLNVTGRGFGIEKDLPQDVVLVIDRSNSMLPGDIEFAKEIAIEYVENMSSPDRGAIMHFDTDVVLMNSLTSNYNRLKTNIENIPGVGEFTYMGEALLEALQELNANGRSDHNHIIILFTDGGWNGDLDPETVAYWARENRTFIFTLDLSGSQDSKLLKEIARITGAQYFPVDSIDKFRAIYDELTTIVYKMAGYDPDPSDSNPLVRDVLPPDIDYVPGSFSIAPDYIYVNDLGYTILEWNLSSLFIGETWTVDFDITSLNPGYREANNFTQSRISYNNWADTPVMRLFPKTMITVKTPDPKPPTLSITVVDDKGRVNGLGDNIRLSWTTPNAKTMAYYLIYRSESQTEFDFSQPWKRTDSHDDNGIIPKRTTWNDTYAAKPGEDNYRQQYYYIIRAISIDGKVSATSRTVGKWTSQFVGYLNTFSLPLEPLQTRDVEWYSTDMRAGYIKWMGSDHRWVRHNSGDCQHNNTDMVVGEGYEAMFSYPTTYTFCGMPGAMIQYENTPFGFDTSHINGDADSLTASVDNYGTITLSWAQPTNIGSDDRFFVLRSAKRDGFWGNLDQDYEQIASLSIDTTTFKDRQAAIPETEYYYVIVPVNQSTGERGVSSYSIGVWTASYDSGYDTLSMPLKLAADQSVNWYCQNIENTVGINYYIYSEYRWGWHSTRMLEGVYDVDVVMGEGYQISTSGQTKFIFVGT
ncbi:MAG: VWA domain-containing protein [Thermoplasmata archaeon]|nr:MAG: VWA domain-containing protein [Thermoplasmata archaeon]